MRNMLALAVLLAGFTAVADSCIVSGSTERAPAGSMATRLAVADMRGETSADVVGDSLDARGASWVVIDWLKRFSTKLIGFKVMVR